MAAELRRLGSSDDAWLKRASALEECGLAAIKLLCGPCGAPHLVPFRCGARTCPTCARKAAKAIAERISARVAVHDLIVAAEPWDGPGRRAARGWKHLVLTTRAVGDATARFDPVALQAQVKRVRSAISPFWRSTPWGRQVTDTKTRRKRSRKDASYVAGQEIAPGGMVHVHMLVYGEYVDQPELQALWSDALGERAIVYIEQVRGGSDGVAGAIREVLKYATKGEKGHRDQAVQAAAVELAFRNVKRISVGGVLRSVRVGDQDGATDDTRAEDLHDAARLVCETCGQAGEWRWEGPISSQVVARNGGFGPLRAVSPKVGPHA